MIDIDFGKNTKFIVVRFKQKLEVYHLDSLCT